MHGFIVDILFVWAHREQLRGVCVCSGIRVLFAVPYLDEGLRTRTWVRDPGQIVNINLDRKKPEDLRISQ